MIHLVSIVTNSCLPYISENLKLTSELNTDSNYVWTLVTKKENGEELRKIIENNLGIRQFKYHVIEVDQTEIDSSFADKRNSHLPSYEHAYLLDIAILRIKDKASHIFVVEPDFFLLKKEWINYLNKIHYRDYSANTFIGTSWDPSILKDSMELPAPHFLSIKLPVPSSFSFTPSLNKRASQKEAKNLRKLSKISRQNVETGYLMYKNTIAIRSIYCRIYFKALQVSTFSRSKLFNYEEIMNLYRLLRIKQGILFEHSYSKRMKKRRKYLVDFSALKYYPSLVLRIISFDYSEKISKKRYVDLSYFSNHQFLLLGSTLIAIHCRKNLFGSDFNETSKLIRMAKELI